MEAFSDGVLAIAITLLVLDLAVRPPGSPLEQFWRGWPSYLAYVVSFLTAHPLPIGAGVRRPAIATRGRTRWAGFVDIGVKEVVGARQLTGNWRSRLSPSAMSSTSRSRSSA